MSYRPYQRKSHPLRVELPEAFENLRNKKEEASRGLWMMIWIAFGGFLASSGYGGWLDVARIFGSVCGMFSLFTIVWFSSFATRHMAMSPNLRLWMDPMYGDALHELKKKIDLHNTTIYYLRAGDSDWDYVRECKEDFEQKIALATSNCPPNSVYREAIRS